MSAKIYFQPAKIGQKRLIFLFGSFIYVILIFRLLFWGKSKKIFDWTYRTLVFFAVLPAKNGAKIRIFRLHHVFKSPQDAQDNELLFSFIGPSFLSMY